MASINPGRTSPYSDDLRWRMVWQRVALGISIRAVANNLHVDLSTVRRIVNNFYVTGDDQKRSYPKDARPNKKLTATVQLTILHTMLQHPQMYLHELQEAVCVLTGVHLSVSSLCTFLRKSNFTRPKLEVIAKQRDEDLRADYSIDVSLHKPEMLVFVDETGSDYRDSLRKYGYSMRGQPPKSIKLFVRGERISVIAAMSSGGVEALKVVRGTVDGDTFLEFIQRDLLPVLLPFDGRNSNSVVIMDNASVHHVAGVESIVTGVGALVHYLPPY